jgi:ribonuclease T2
MHFNKTQLDPIKEQLQQYWANIHNGSMYSLWKHEWTKHGTCATALPALDSEDKYFGQGLKWIKQYNMKNILSQSGIEPDVQGYFPLDVWNGVQKSLGKNPIVRCHVDPVSVIIILIYNFTQVHQINVSAHFPVIPHASSLRLLGK